MAQNSWVIILVISSLSNFIYITALLLVSHFAFAYSSKEKWKANPLHQKCIITDKVFRALLGKKNLIIIIPIKLMQNKQKVYYLVKYQFPWRKYNRTTSHQISDFNETRLMAWFCCFPWDKWMLQCSYIPKIKMMALLKYYTFLLQNSVFNRKSTLTVY